MLKDQQLMTALAQLQDQVRVPVMHRQPMACLHPSQHLKVQEKQLLQQLHCLQLVQQELQVSQLMIVLHLMLIVEVK